MTVTTSNQSTLLMSRVTRYALGILLLTSVHHAYGAYVYQSPWRLHVVPLSIAAGAVIYGAERMLRTRGTTAAGTIAFWIFCAVALAFPFGMIGLLEGGYNHALKNLLYFGGASPELMTAWFPPPTYELPNDLFFEITGVLQLIPGVMGSYYLLLLIRSRWTARGRGQVGRAELPEHSWGS